MKVRNLTSYPTRQVTNLVRREARAAGVDDVTVTVRWSRDGYATGYWRAYWYPDRGEDGPQISVRLPRPDVEIKDYRPYPRLREEGRSFPLADWREALVAVVAHEMEHHRQMFVLGETSGRRGSGRRRSQVELRCDLAAYRAWTHHRNLLESRVQVKTTP